MDDVFTIRSAFLPEDTRVVGFRGTEGISMPYCFEIFLSLGSDEGRELDLGDTINARATLCLDRKDGRPPFQFHGQFSELTLVHELGGRALVRALLVPKLWQLTQTYHSRIFTHQSIPDIIKAILEDGGVTSDDYVLKLSGHYPPEEHVCQYQESHFDFISRRMEREGLYYYFEQGDDAEKLIITDNKSFHDDLGTGPIRFYPLTGADVTAKESLHTFACRHRALPGTVRFKDYDHTKPKLDVTGHAPVSKTGLGEINIHGARFFSPEAGKRLATLRAEEMLAREVVYTGSGTAFYLRPGYTFKLEDYARSPADTKYLPIHVEHYGNQAATTPELRQLTGLDSSETYRVDVTAIPDKAQFRAERSTPWPRVYGTEHGVIDGEASSEYAQIDDHGRYLVRFAFDESELGAGKASTRVRMMQPHGGGVEGWHFPLRKGTEVLFTFLGGDPDRPVIAGVVPNALTPSPVTHRNHTKNVIQTGGRNRLEIEDTAGQQRITLSTPHANTFIRMGDPVPEPGIDDPPLPPVPEPGIDDGPINSFPSGQHELVVKTDKNALIQTGANFDIWVTGFLTESVGQKVTQMYFANHDTRVSGHRQIDVLGGQDHHVVGWYNLTPDNLKIETGAYHTFAGDVIQEFKGSVLQNYAGPVQQNFGATKATYAKLDWFIPGGAKITASDWHVSVPKSLWDFASIDWSYAKKSEVCGIKLAVAGLSVATIAASVTAGERKLDAVVTKIDLAAVRVSNVGIKVDAGAFYSALRGLFSFA